MKTREDVRDFILNLEKTFPVDSWMIDNVHVWPILRTKIYMVLSLAVDNMHKKRKRKVAPTPKKATLLQRIINKSKFKNWYNERTIKWYLSQYSTSDFLFATSNTCRSDFNGRSYDKFADPILEGSNYSGCIVEHSQKYLFEDLKIFKKKRVHFLYDLDSLLLKRTSRKKRNAQKKKVQLKEYSQFLEYLSKTPYLDDFILNYSEEELLKRMNRFQDYVLAYSLILGKVQPKIVFSVCFYSFPVFALNFAAKEKGIKTVEIQHGPQNDLHMSYANWSKVPQNGFNTMPEIFWNWDKNSQQTIEAWANSSKVHSSIVGGNLWLDFLHSTEKNQEKDSILYTLQNLEFEYLLPDYIIRAIKENTSFKWHLRMHPGQLEYKEELMSFLKEKEIWENVELEESSKLPLPILLEKSKVHITNFSGCAIEAAICNVPTIFIDKIGRSMFFDLISKEQAVYASSVNFKEQLQLLLTSKTPQIKNKSENLQHVLFTLVEDQP